MKVHTLWTFHAGEWRKFYYHCAGEPSKRKQPSIEMRESLFLEQGGQCAYCEIEIRTDPSDFDCDHIIPVRSGGPTCLANLQLLCVRCHRRKSALERVRECCPEKKNQAIETVNMTPRSIPEFVSGADHVIHIAEYSIEYGAYKRTGAIKSKKRKPVRTPAITGTTKYSNKLVIIFHPHHVLDVGAIHKRVRSFYDVGYTGLYAYGDCQAVYIQGSHNNIRMGPGKMRTKCQDFGKIHEVKKYQHREGTMIGEVGTFRKHGREATDGKRESPSGQLGREFTDKVTAPLKLGGNHNINLQVHAFGHEDVSHISVEQFKQLIGGEDDILPNTNASLSEAAKEKLVDRAYEFLHQMAELLYENPHNSNVVFSVKSGHIAYLKGHSWLNMRRDEVGKIFENWKDKTKQTLAMLEKSAGEGFPQSSEAGYVSHLLGLLDDDEPVTPARQKIIDRRVKQRSLTALDNLNGKIKGVQSLTGKSLKRVSGKEYRLKDEHVVIGTTWHELESMGGAGNGATA